MIRKLSTVTVCLTSNFAWDNFISCGIPQRKRFKSLPDIFCDLNRKDKINTDLASSFVISLSVFWACCHLCLADLFLLIGAGCILCALVYLLPSSFYCWTSRACRGGCIQYMPRWDRFTLSQCSLSTVLPTVYCNHNAVYFVWEGGPVPSYCFFTLPKVELGRR